MNPRISKGFTVIELMITLSVAAILLAMAIPSFTTMTMNNRITTQANEFLSAMVLARSEALKRVSRVTVCSSSNGTSCASTGGWEQGWIVFNDKDNDAQVDSTVVPATNEPILRYTQAITGGNTLRGSTNVAAYVSFVSSGNTRLRLSDGGGPQLGTLVLCDSRGAGAHARTLRVSVTGRTGVSTTVPVSCGT